MVSKTDIRSQPAYTVAEAARYLKVAPATLRSWIVGRPYPTGSGTARSSPLIRPARNPPPILSFWNLIEAHVLRSLRTDHAVKMVALRRAIRYAQQTLKIERLLLSPELRTDAGKLLLDRYGQLIELSASGQVAMRLGRMEISGSVVPRDLWRWDRRSKTDRHRRAHCLWPTRSCEEGHHNRGHR